MNPFLATDGYKTGHHKMYPEGTSLVYSNFTPRSDKYAPKGVEKGYIISFGQQMVIRQIKEMFDKYFFDKETVKDITSHFKRIKPFVKEPNEEAKSLVKK